MYTHTTTHHILKNDEFLFTDTGSLCVQQGHIPRAGIEPQGDGDAVSMNIMCALVTRRFSL